MSQGPIRQMLENLKLWAKVFEVDLETAADAFDKFNRIKSGSTESVPSSLMNMTPAKGKH